MLQRALEKVNSKDDKEASREETSLAGEGQRKANDNRAVSFDQTESTSKEASRPAYKEGTDAVSAPDKDLYNALSSVLVDERSFTFETSLVR